MTSELPFVDVHAVTVPASREAVWAALRDHVQTSMRLPGLLARALGAEPASGFALAEARRPDLLRLTGRHRFSSYELRFELSAEPGPSTAVRASTYAAFPGPHGRLYRALVIGSGAHAVATRRLLASIPTLVGRDPPPDRRG